MNRARELFYRTLLPKLQLHIRPGDSVVEVNPRSDFFSRHFEDYQAVEVSSADVAGAEDAPVDSGAGNQAADGRPCDYLLLHGNVHSERDVQSFLQQVRSLCGGNTRVIVIHYSSLWRPFYQLASTLGIRREQAESNWITASDLANLLLLTNYRLVQTTSGVLFPFRVPLLHGVFNRVLCHLPLFRHFNAVHFTIARKLDDESHTEEWKPSVSVVVPARNESGNIEDAVLRLPKMGPDDELIFIEGNSTDDTWERIQEIQRKHGERMTIRIGQQDGKGKGDAVRKGYAMAEKDILMILDADLTVPPEDLPKFYQAIRSRKGEFINGTRLVYPMEKEAMRFFNLLGNKFFAAAFSFVLGQRFRDTLCGTKVMTRENYLKLAERRSYFGDFDPFGDFDLLFGSARMALEIVEVPIRYRERTYGDTNISRWHHGMILLRMLWFASRKIKFI